jgi:hypothetical protein
MKKSNDLKPSGDGNKDRIGRVSEPVCSEHENGGRDFAIIECIKQSDILEAINRLKHKESFSAIDVLRECNAEPGLYVDILRQLFNLSENRQINLFVYSGADFNRCGFWFSH